MPTAEPPARVRDLLARGIRPIAAVVVALAVTAVIAAADGGAPLPLVLGAICVASGMVLQHRAGTASAIATSAIVAGAVLLVVGARAVLAPTGDALDLFLTVAGGAFVAGGLFLDERRLVSLGILQWMVVIARPEAGSVPFRHCLVATDLAVPVPELDGLLVLGAGALAIGSVMRFAAWRPEAARGAEVTGLLLLHGVLVAKAVELPDLAVLCGAGRGIDPGWVAVGMLVAVASAGYGAAGRDAVWAAAGGGALAAHGLLATTLSGEPVWSVVGFVPLALVLWWAERAGVRWPRSPGFGRRRPWREGGEP